MKNKKIKENWTTSNKDETSGGWYCRRCGISLYSSDLYCLDCLRKNRTEQIILFLKGLNICEDDISKIISLTKSNEK